MNYYKKAHMTDYSELAGAIVSCVGGKENVKRLTHCATRLRFLLKDDSLVEEAKLKGTRGVLGTVNAMGTYQIIIGNTVGDVYRAIQNEQLGGNVSADESDSPKKKREGNLFVHLCKEAVAAIAAIVAPVFPAIIASGLINALLVILTKLGLVGTDSTTYTILFTAGKVAFYFLPIFCGYTASLRFGCSPIYGLFLACLLLHPNLLSLMGGEGSVTLFGLPVYKATYTSSLIPIILSVWVLSYVEKFVDRHLHKNLRHTIKPILIIACMLVITLVVTAPLGALVGNAIARLLLVVYEKVPQLGVILVSLLAPFLVLTGSHLSLLPISISSFDTYGYDMLMYVAFIGMNFSQVGVSLAAMLKAKSKGLKETAAGTALTALTGITEPALYGISLRLKTPFIATIAACFANGVWCAIRQVKVFTMAGPSILTYPMIYIGENAPGNVLNATIAILITLAVSFGVTWILGFDETGFDN